jgi:hypothetical protein
LEFALRGVYVLKPFGSGRSCVYTMAGMDEELEAYGITEERLDKEDK